MALSHSHSPTELSRAVFLDKDGTLIENVPYNVDPSQIRLNLGAREALTALHRSGYRLVVISNQSGVARGFFPIEALGPVRQKVEALMAEFDVPLDDFLYCPHLPAGKVAKYSQVCDCRKPAPGMILQACQTLGIDPKRSWMVGDILDDVEAGQRAGCRTILLDNGHETEWLDGPYRKPDHKVSNLAEAATWILAEDRRSHEPRGG